MDRLTALFEQLSLPEISRVLRHAALAALGLGIVAVAVSLLLSHGLIGLGAVIGLALGLLNIRVAVLAVKRVSADNPDKPRRVLATKSLYRLGLTTLVVIGLLLASVQLGFGVLGGIGAFYFVLLVSLLRSLLGANARGAIT